MVSHAVGLCMFTWSSIIWTFAGNTAISSAMTTRMVRAFFMDDKQGRSRARIFLLPNSYFLTFFLSAAIRLGLADREDFI